MFLDASTSNAFGLIYAFLTYEPIWSFGFKSEWTLWSNELLLLLLLVLFSISLYSLIGKSLWLLRIIWSKPFVTVFVFLLSLSSSFKLNFVLPLLNVMSDYYWRPCSSDAFLIASCFSKSSLIIFYRLSFSTWSSLASLSFHNFSRSFLFLTDSSLAILS